VVVSTTAALIAGRRGANAVTPEDFEAAIERVVAGLQKKTQVLSPEEKRVRPRFALVCCGGCSDNSSLDRENHLFFFFT